MMRYEELEPRILKFSLHCYTAALDAMLLLVLLFYDGSHLEPTHTKKMCILCFPNERNVTVLAVDVAESGHRARLDNFWSR
jgi:hypothetical protein